MAECWNMKRRFMGRLLVSLIILGHTSGASAKTCAQPAEARALAVITLKSELMVGALTCGRDKQYDRFMNLFLPYIQAQQQVMDGYFERGFGLAGQMAEDDYVTAMANGLSEASHAPGSDFCARNGDVFLQVLTLTDPDDLTSFIAANPLPQPDATPLCPVALGASAGQLTPRHADDEVAAEGAPVLVEPLAPLPGYPATEHARFAHYHHPRPRVAIRPKSSQEQRFGLVSM
jgi:hypothetical protein